MALFCNFFQTHPWRFCKISMKVYWYYDYALLCRKWHLSSSSGGIVLRQGNRLSSLKELYVAYQNSIRKRILDLFSIPSYLPCYNSNILKSYYLGQITATSFMQRNGLNEVEW